MFKSPLAHAARQEPPLSLEAAAQLWLLEHRGLKYIVASERCDSYTVECTGAAKLKVLLSLHYRGVDMQICMGLLPQLLLHVCTKCV